MLPFYTNISLDQFLDHAITRVTLYLDVLLQNLAYMPINTYKLTILVFVTVTRFLLKITSNVKV